tara:strand:+ start:2999 stop:3520 length:522 start_codon:yes stop_codon:yes gene_type:complete
MGKKLMLSVRVVGIFFFALILSGCGAKLILPTPVSLSHQEAVNVVERAFMEQAEKHKPANIELTDKYVLLSYGVHTKTKGRGIGSLYAIHNTAFATGSSSSISRVYAKNKRIYFQSMYSIKLYSKRRYFIVLIKDESGRVVERIFIYSKALANRFVSALMYLKGEDSSSISQY